MTVAEPDLQAALADALDRHDVPGAVLGVQRGGERLVVAAGHAHAESRRTMTPATVFPVGTASALVTASVVHQVLHERAWPVESPAADVLRELRDRSLADATLADLFGHTTGLDDVVDDLGRAEESIARLAASAATVGQLTSVGSCFSYSALGYVLLARFVEGVSGLPWRLAVSQYLSGPLGMQRTGVLPEDAVTEEVAVGHRRSPAGIVTPRRRWATPYSLAPAYGIHADAGDLLRLCDAHLHGGLDVLAPPAVAAMRRHHVALPEPTAAETGWALGWAEFDAGPYRVLGYEGRLDGFSAHVRIVPAEDLGVVLLTNAGHGADLARELLPDLLDELGLEVNGSPAGTSLRDPGRYAGRYRRQQGELRILRQGPRLTALAAPVGLDLEGTADASGPLEPVGRDQFLLLGRSPSQHLTFLDLDGTGRITHLFTDLRLFRRTA